MALLNIITKTSSQGDSLRRTSRPVEEVTPRIITLLDDMAETMHERNGVGLAAPQVGVFRRVIIVEAEEGNLIEFINPEIIQQSGVEEDGEGCLSIPGKRGDVPRPTKIKVSALNREGKQFTIDAEGFLARVICHEIDHLDGILIDQRTTLEADE